MAEYMRGFEQKTVPPMGEDSGKMAYLPLIAILGFGVFSLIVAYLVKMLAS
ncbi:MAG: hypothetical protein QW781_06325 [Methanothrix sp.]|uniref:hypothetical protein n=1 Tax=Methanothrix sp. TaxID=90426 RepID=UPI00316760D7|nr:hypothetical protein [Methanothrix sp.]